MKRIYFELECDFCSAIRCCYTLEYAKEIGWVFYGKKHFCNDDHRMLYMEDIMSNALKTKKLKQDLKTLSKRAKKVLSFSEPRIAMTREDIGES